jgi:DNA-binding response OmpR family regulator
MGQVAPIQAQLANCRILIVEDEYYLADDLARTLRDRGAEVLGPVGTISEADAIVSNGGIDCAILDVNLRGEMIFGLADRLQAEGIPFLVASGYSSGALPERFNGVPKIEKPFSAADLIAALPLAIQRAR